jgi:hypothetical protein
MGAVGQRPPAVAAGAAVHRPVADSCRGRGGVVILSGAGGA